MSNFDDLTMAVASFGGNNAVKFDDLGMPSIMVGIPKMKYSDIITGGTQETLPWWIVDGVEKEVIWESKYINVVVNDRAYSLPMKDPKCYINFDQALAACRRKGEGWHLNQNGVFAAINLWCQRNGFVPRGNTNWDRSYVKPYEKGINTYIDGSHGGGRTATGSGPVTWYHDGTPAGIADLCGNCWEWVAGMRIVNGEIQIIPYGNSMKSDCNMGADSTEWKAIKPDGTLVEPGTAGTLHYDYVSGKLVINTSTNSTGSWNIPFGALTAASGVNIPQIAIAAGLIKDSADDYGASGHQQYVNTDGERLPRRGSVFDSTSNGGGAALNLNNPRSNANNNISFRSASPHFCQQSCPQVDTSSASGLKGLISIPKAASREP